MVTDKRAQEGHNFVKIIRKKTMWRDNANTLAIWSRRLEMEINC